MPDTRIHLLPDGSALTGAEKIPISQIAVTKKVELNDFLAFFDANSSLTLTQILANGNTTGEQDFSSDDFSTRLSVKNDGYGALLRLLENRGFLLAESAPIGFKGFWASASGNAMYNETLNDFSAPNNNFDGHVTLASGKIVTADVFKRGINILDFGGASALLSSNNGNVNFPFVYLENGSEASLAYSFDKYFSAKNGETVISHPVKSTFNSPLNVYSGNIHFLTGSGVDTTDTGASDVLNIGTANANVINYGNSSTIHNFLGTAIYELQVNSYVEDKLMTLNYGGSVASGIGVGYEIEEDNIITGYQKTNAARDGWSFKAPANTSYTDFVFSATSARSKTFQDTTSTIAEYGNKLSVFAATTSAELASVISDETGTGALVFANSPTLVDPIVGTQSAGDNSTKAASTAYVDTAITAASTTFKKLTADVTSTITTETVLTDLTFAVQANSTYLIRGRASVGCNGAGGVKMGGKWPSGATSQGQAIGRAINNTSFVTLAIATSGSLATGLNTVNSQGGYAFIEILLIVGATAGNFELIFASQTAGETSTIIANGTVLEFVKIA